MATTYTISVEGMHCGSCPLLIDETLEDVPGVLSSHTSLKDGRSIVEMDPTQCAPEEAVAAIGELGYTARQQL